MEAMRTSRYSALESFENMIPGDTCTNFFHSSGLTMVFRSTFTWGGNGIYPREQMLFLSME